jgi:hypothetical protein
MSGPYPQLYLDIKEMTALQLMGMILFLILTMDRHLDMLITLT